MVNSLQIDFLTVNFRINFGAFGNNRAKPNKEEIGKENEYLRYYFGNNLFLTNDTVQDLNWIIRLCFCLQCGRVLSFLRGALLNICSYFFIIADAESMPRYCHL